MIKNNLLKKISAISCALVFLTQLSLPSTTASASTYSTSSSSENTKPAIAANNKLNALTDGLNNAVAAKSSTEGISKELTAAASNEISYGVTGSTTVGSTIDIAVNVSSVSNLYGSSVDFVYDPSLLQIQSVDKGSLYTSDTAQVPEKSIENGQVHIAVTLTNKDTPPISGSGSIAIIKAKVLKAGTVNFKTTNSIDNLSLSGVTTCVKLSDKFSDKMGYTFVDKAISLTFPTLVAGKYEENAVGLNYTGTWTSQSNSSYNSGSAMISTATGSYFTFKFNGTGIRLYGLKNFNCGIAKITIDNTIVNTDLYSANTAFKQLFFEKTDLTSGEHTIKVEVSGSKNTSSTNTYLVLDNFEVVNTMPQLNTISPGNYEQDNPNVSYVGSWTSQSNSSYNSGSAMISTATGSYFTFKFNGTSIRLYGLKNFNCGIAKITIDNTIVNTDLYSANTAFKQLFFEKTGLTSGEHTIKVEVSGSKNTSATNTYLVLDNFEVVNTVPQLNTISSGNYEQDNPNVSYVGSWTSQSNSSYNSGSAMISTATGSYFTFKFNGTGIRLYGLKNFNCGIAKITIDNTIVNTDLYSANTAFKQLFFEKTDLTSGEHTIKVEVSGSKNTSSTNTYLVLDNFEVVNTMPQLNTISPGNYEQDNPNVSYVGSWTSQSNSSYNSGSAMISTATGSYFTFKFNGTSIRLYGLKNFNCGIAKITIDNTIVNTDLYSANTAFKQLFFEKTGLTSGEHTIKVEVSGSKNTSATNTYLVLDNFQIM